MNGVRPALFVGTDIELGAGMVPIDDDCRSGGGTVAGSRLEVVRAVEDARLGLPTVVEMRIGDLHRLLARFPQFVDADLDQRVVFLLEAFRVGTDIGPLDRVGKEQWVSSGSLGTGRASTCGREEVRIVHIEGGIRKTQVDFPLNPAPQIVNADRARVFVFQDCGGPPVSRKALPQRSFLVFGLEPRNFHGMARGELAFVEGPLQVGRQLREFQAAVDICRGTTHFSSNRFHSVAGGVSLEERLVPQGFIEFVDVLALQVLNDSQLQSFDVTEVHDAGRNAVFPGCLRGPPAPLPTNDLIAVCRYGADEDRLQDAVRLDVPGQLRQGCIVHAAAGVGFGGFDLVETDFLDKYVLSLRDYRCCDDIRSAHIVLSFQFGSE